MKKLNKILMVVAMIVVAIPAFGAMSTSNVRKNTRFLTDRMAYELNLSQEQYDDVYEINYDFINNVRYIMNDVARGDYYASDRYYDFLDVRNDDLRWILSSSQYARFMGIEYFYRPIYTQNRRWAFRIYNIYANINFFYFGKPYHYSTYCGGHYRTHYNNISFYKGRWNTRYNFRDRYHDYMNIRDNRHFDNHRRNDFGITSRPNPDRRPMINSRPDNNRRPGRDNYRNDNDHRPENNVARPDRNDRPSRVENNRGEASRPSASSRPSRNENQKFDNNRSERRNSSRSEVKDNSSKKNSSSESNSRREIRRR